MGIRPATNQDVAAVVKVHLASFRGFFLSSLGPRFLRLLYLRMMQEGVGLLLVHETDGQVDGFVGGVYRQEGFYGELVRAYKWQFGYASMGAIVRRPWILPRLLRAMRRPAEARQSAAQACLMSLGVLPSAEGKGIGRALITAFCDSNRRHGEPSVCLTTDKLNNERANKFYRGMGFTIAREYTTAEGREMYEYVKQLT